MSIQPKTEWKIHAESDHGRAKIVLSADGQAAGIITIPMHEYVAIWRDLMTHVIKTSTSAIAEKLQERLWQDAQSMFGLDPEQAKEKLLQFGWNQQKIEAYADELAREVAKKLADSVPGNR